MTNSDAGPNAESDSVTYRECYRRMKRDHGRLGGLFLGWLLYQFVQGTDAVRLTRESERQRWRND
jgi:hypothetical protein